MDSVVSALRACVESIVELLYGLGASLGTAAFNALLHAEQPRPADQAHASDLPTGTVGTQTSAS